MQNHGICKVQDPIIWDQQQRQIYFLITVILLPLLLRYCALPQWLNIMLLSNVFHHFFCHFFYHFFYQIFKYFFYHTFFNNVIYILQHTIPFYLMLMIWCYSILSYRTVIAHITLISFYYYFISIQYFILLERKINFYHHTVFCRNVPIKCNKESSICFFSKHVTIKTIYVEINFFGSSRSRLLFCEEIVF